MSTELINVDDLADALGLPRSQVTSNPRAAQIVAHTNGLISEHWAAPTDPAPTSKVLLALKVATRAWGTTPGRGHVESVTTTTDGTSKTERYATASTHAAGGVGVYLTASELADLGGPPADGYVFTGSVRMHP